MDRSEGNEVLSTAASLPASLETWTSIVVSITQICFGIIGIVGGFCAIISFAIRYTAKGSARDNLERQTIIALGFLSVSDIFYCVNLIPSSICNVTLGSIYKKSDICAYYTVFSPYLLHLFLRTSLWMTGILITSRLVPACHPSNGDKSFLFIKCLGCLNIVALAVLQLPLLWTFRLRKVRAETYGDIESYIFEKGTFLRNRAMHEFFTQFWGMAFCIFPMTLICFFAANLIIKYKGLRKKTQTRKISGLDLRRPNRSGMKASGIILQLCICHILTIFPYEVNNMYFTIDIGHAKQGGENVENTIVRVIANLSMSFRFVMYMCVNMTLRKAFMSLFWRTTLRSTTSSRETVSIEEPRSQRTSVSKRPDLETVIEMHESQSQVYKFGLINETEM